ncbi:MAG: hypothetical protein ACREQ5_20365, partial [Candidatus Dormibacteria bacterium]
GERRDMGREAPCTLRFGERVGEGTAYLDTDALVLRQERRLAVPLSELIVGETADGRVEVSFPGGAAVLHLDGAAQRGAESVRSGPRGRLDRLGVKPGQCIGVVGPVEDGFVEELRGRAAVVVTGRSVPAGADIIFLVATQREELGRVPGLGHFIAPGGVLWVIRPRGGREITEQDVAVSAKAAGMTSGRSVRFTTTQTADRLVPPAPRRRPRSR